MNAFTLSGFPPIAARRIFGDRQTLAPRLSIHAYAADLAIYGMSARSGFHARLFRRCQPPDLQSLNVSSSFSYATSEKRKAASP